MKKIASLLGVLITLVTLTTVSVTFANDTSKMNLKVGDEIYACNCGEECPCKTMSREPGKCTCDKEMVKAKVTKIEGGMAILMAPGWTKELPFPTTGKFMCNCGPKCKCDTISQTAGKCTCGKEMKKVE